MAIDPRTGWVKAVVGGRSFRESPFNRALDARRQPGSAFKPFIYAAALESGLSPGSVIDRLDEPIPTQQGPWLPRGEHETSSTTLRTGLALSSNRAAAHLLLNVGIYRTLDLAQRAGISSPLPAVPSLALGSGELSLFELTSAYGVFANRGVWKEPMMIRRVVDRDGREVYSASGSERSVISESTAYLMASMMSDVLSHGTASARVQGVKFRAAGKTGTSQDPLEFCVLNSEFSLRVPFRATGWAPAPTRAEPADGLREHGELAKDAGDTGEHGRVPLLGDSRRTMAVCLAA